MASGRIPYCLKMAAVPSRGTLVEGEAAKVFGLTGMSKVKSGLGYLFNFGFFFAIKLIEISLPSLSVAVLSEILTLTFTPLPVEKESNSEVLQGQRSKYR